MRVELALAVCLIAAVPARAEETSRAPDVVVFVEPTLRPAIEAIGALFQARTGAPVRIQSAPTALLLGEIPHTRDDVMVLQGDAAADQAIARKIAAPTPRIPLGRNRLVLARRGGGTAQALQSIAADGPVAIVDAPVPDALGALSHEVLASSGWPGPGARVIGVARDADATYLLGTREAAYAVVYQTDVAADASLSVAATLPDPAAPISYTALRSFNTPSPNVGAFLDFLRTPEAAEKLRSAGLEVAAP